MIKRFLFLLLAFIFSFSYSYSQQNVCGTYPGYLEDDKKKYPEFYKSIEDKNKQLDREHRNIINRLPILNNLNQRSTNTKKIIPVVVHVIYDDQHGGNITNEQIQNALDILNNNINGQADNFLSRTPDIFAAFRGDLNVEFRLAKKDPNGNPTTGINRVFSSKTYEPSPRNAVKALSYWNSYEYFNIWTLKKFLPQDDGNTLLGFAQFPFSGSMSTDGVVLLSSQMVSGGTLTHEVGHWLGLRHVWGDQDCGNDNIGDTPPARAPNYGVDLNDYPYHVGLQNQGCIADSLNWAGEMFVNYMDYSDDADVTMFTKGQNDLMNTVLEGDGVEPGYRQYLWSEKNLEKTGLLANEDGKLSRPPTCTQVASFTFSNGTSPVVCLGERIYLKGNKNQFGLGNVTSFVWDFGNGETNSTGDNFIFYEYPEAGDYDVSLTVNYTELTTVRTSDLSLIPDADIATINEEEVEKIVQASTYDELADMGAINIQEIIIDSMGVYYDMQDSSYFRGTLLETEYVASYTNSCTSVEVKESFFKVGSGNNNSEPPTSAYSFEDGIDSDWSLDVPNIDILPWSFNVQEEPSWDVYDGVANNGTASLKIKAQGGAGYISSDQSTWKRHSIVSKAFDLSNFNTPAIKFSWSGAAVNTFPVNILNVHYSVNCGEDWLPLVELEPSDKAVCLLSNGTYSTNLNHSSCVDTVIQYGTANSQLHSGDYLPRSSDWRDTVITKNQLSSDNVKFKFEYIVKGSGNNFYLDDIKIGEQNDLLFDQNVSLSSKISIYPNPTNGSSSIILENLKDTDVQVSLTNVLGQDIKLLFNGKVSNNSFVIDLSSEIVKDKGVYFVNVISNGDVVTTKKLVKE